MFPIDEVLPALAAALAAGPCAVLVAPPGAGKTTRAPLALREAPWLCDGKIVLLEPRRVAARAAAAHMAASLGERVGETVGLRVRLETRVSPATRIEVVTEGVFTRMILDDPTLSGVGHVIFDEFHERSLDADLGLALARDAQQGLREDLRILVMSATLDGARVADGLGQAPVIESKGRMFPVAFRHLGRDPCAPIEPQMARAIRRALATETGSILAFLPGAREIERVAERLREEVRDPAVDVRALYGALDARDQDAAIAPAPPGRRKVVLATSIAETGLTIEGVRVVVDSGLARRPAFEPATGLTRLETVRASQASVAQRAGRAGRLEPGVCWRLWEEGETRALAPYDRPEILEADLSSLVLDLAAWGVADPAQLLWLDPPPKAAWSEAVTLLEALGALEAGRLTEHGRAIAGFGLPPRLAHMLLAAPDKAVAAQIAAILTEQGLGGRDADLADRLVRFASDRSPRAEAARRLARNWAQKAGDVGAGPGDAGATLARAFPERVAKRRTGKPGEYLMANGRACAIEPTHALAKSEWLAVAEAQGQGPRPTIVLAAALEEAPIEALFAGKIEDAEEIAFDAETDRIRARGVRRLGAITLKAAPLDRPAPHRLADAWVDAVRARGLGLVPWTEEARQTRARIALMRRLDGELWPDLGDETLIATLEDWFAPAAEGASRREEIAPRLADALAGLLPWDLRRRLEAEAPSRFETPAGSSRAIDYAVENGPAVEVRLQELFGLDRHPAVVSGRAPLLLLLTSPAGRPVQTTRDLPGFWRGSYASVRADLRGRYPKHPWPEDPLSAPPTLRAKPRSGG